MNAPNACTCQENYTEPACDVHGYFARRPESIKCACGMALWMDQGLDPSPFVAMGVSHLPSGCIATGVITEPRKALNPPTADLAKLLSTVFAGLRDAGVALSPEDAGRLSEALDKSTKRGGPS